jgi:tetratricopeptide (TPR) repeat protein
MEIRILSAGKEMGPYSESQVRQYLSEGIISPSDRAMCNRWPAWQPLEQFLANLPSLESPPTNVVQGESRSLTVQATSKGRAKRGLIVLKQPIFARNGENAPKPTRTGKTALTIEAPRPTTQLPPVAKFIRREEPRNIKGSVNAGQLAPAEFFAVPAAEPVPQAPQPALPDATPDGPSAEEAEPVPTPDAPPLEPGIEESEGLPSLIIYSAAVIGLLLLAAVFAVGYLIWHFSAPAPRGPVSPVPAAAATTATNTAGGTENPRTAADYARRGFERESRGDLEGAISDYDHAIDLDPKNPQTFYWRAVARQTKGDWDDAFADYNALLALRPDDADAYSNRGFVRQTRGDLDGALADYSEALARNPKIAVAFYNIGLIKVRRGDLDGGIDAYNHALDLNPNLTRAYYNRGKAKAAEGNLDGAIADYTQALTLDPEIATAYLERGVARQTKGDSDGALGDYSQALEHDSNMAAAYYNRGYIELLRGDLDAAIGDSTHAISLDPGDAKAFFNRGLAELGQADFQTAETDLRKYGELSPHDADSDCARLYLWVSVTLQQARDKADEELAAALENDWNSSPEDLTSKIAAFLLGHIREPEIIADAASPDLSREPGRYCKVWYFAGIKRLIAGDAPTALSYFQKAVATDQKSYCEYVFARAQVTALGQIRQASSQPSNPVPPQ